MSFGLMQLSPVGRPTSNSIESHSVSGWRCPDVTHFKFSNKSHRRQVVRPRLRWRASGSPIQEAAGVTSRRTPGGITRRSMLALTALSIQPALVWSSNAQPEELNGVF